MNITNCETSDFKGGTAPDAMLDFTISNKFVSFQLTLLVWKYDAMPNTDAAPLKHICQWIQCHTWCKSVFFCGAKVYLRHIFITIFNGSISLVSMQYKWLSRYNTHIQHLLYCLILSEWQIYQKKITWFFLEAQLSAPLASAGHILKPTNKRKTNARVHRFGSFYIWNHTKTM